MKIFRFYKHEIQHNKKQRMVEIEIKLESLKEPMDLPKPDDYFELYEQGLKWSIHWVARAHEIKPWLDKHGIKGKKYYVKHIVKKPTT
jgi:hypothetical protein